MTASVIPNTNQATSGNAAKQYWLDIVRTAMINAARACGGTVGIHTVHQFIKEGKLPVPASSSWMSSVFRSVYFKLAGTINFPYERIYAGEGTKVCNLYEYVHSALLHKLAVGKASPRMQRILSDCKAW